MGALRCAYGLSPLHRFGSTKHQTGKMSSAGFRKIFKRHLNAIKRRCSKHNTVRVLYRTIRSQTIRSQKAQRKQIKYARPDLFSKFVRQRNPQKQTQNKRAVHLFLPWPLHRQTTAAAVLVFILASLNNDLRLCCRQFHLPVCNVYTLPHPEGSYRRSACKLVFGPGPAQTYLFLLPFSRLLQCFNFIYTPHI